MKKKILTFILTSSFILAEDCTSYLKSADINNQSSCVKATECFKTQTKELEEALNKFKITSQNLNNALLKYANDSARCEVYKEYARKNTDIKNWQELAKDCTNHYSNLSNQLVTARRNLNTFGRRIPTLENMLNGANASLGYIKNKCE